MAGTALANFNDFMKVTGPRYLSSAEDVINEAVKNTYILGRFLKGKGTDVSIQGGKTINDSILFDESSTYDHYKPNATFSWSNPQVITDLEINWRFSVDHMSWTDQEVELNVSEGLSRSAQKVAYKRLKRIKEMRLWTSFLNGMEADLWKGAYANGAEMETNTGSLPYGLQAFISENTSNYHSFNTGDATTVMGVAPGTESKWRNQVSTYDYADPDDSDGDQDGLLDKFDEMFLKVQFIPPATKQEYFEKDNLNRQFICCSRGGINLYKRMLRDANDTLVNKQDPAYNMPQYSGIDLVYVSTLDDAAINGDTVADDTETAVVATDENPGYRYWWLNGNYLTPVYHTRRYMEKHDPMRHPNQPFTTVQPVDCWWNLFCKSRQRQGIICPQ
jgi:hypothetical protein